MAHGEAETDNQKAGTQHEENTIQYDMSIAQESKNHVVQSNKIKLSSEFFP